MIKIIIFDLDGVLVDACEWHRLSLNAALKEIANFEISVDDHYANFNGLPISGHNFGYNFFLLTPS